MATTRDSVIYDSVYVKKYLADNRNSLDGAMVIPFELTAVSAAAISDIYNLCVLPANCKVVGFDVVTTTNAASSAPFIGDVGDTDRYMAATAMVTANTHGVLANTGAGYKPTADTIVFATLGGAAPTVGAVLKGYFLVIPGK